MRSPSRGGTSPTTCSARTSFARAMTVARRRSGTSSTPARARAAAARARGDESAEEPVAAGEVEADRVDAAERAGRSTVEIARHRRWDVAAVAPEAVVGARPGTEETEPDAAGRDDAVEHHARRGDTQLEKYKRPKTWRDILSATRERVKKGRAAMSTPMAEDGTTNEAWSRDVATDARIRGQI